MSGVDLARVALRAAMEQARKNGSGQKAKRKPRTGTTVRRDGREPMGLGAAIGALVTEWAWELPAAGATLRERWAAIAPELAGHVVAVGFDADSGRLTVCPESSAWATKARLEQIRVVAAANKAAGRQVVSALRILPPGAVPMSDRADVAPGRGAPPGRAAVLGGSGGCGSGGAADEGDAGAVAPGVRARRRPRRCLGPDRAGPYRAPPPGRGDRGRCPTPCPSRAVSCSSIDVASATDLS